MLFITNRSIQQGLKLKIGRRIDFDMKNNMACQSVYFCLREEKQRYIEVGGFNFMSELKRLSAEQILIYIHGYSNLPEEDIFPRSLALQNLFDEAAPNLVYVVPLIWPCDDDLGLVKDYWDDQKSADASAFAFGRLMEMFMEWRARPENQEVPCLKRINVLAHSMGNRVLRQTLAAWARYDRGGEVPLLFRNTFMVAADIVNESLERGEEGEHIANASRNVVVYFASDDLALRASKVANVKNKVTSRRLGHTGPESMDRVNRNVFAVDCDDVNTAYDPIKGHSYFLHDSSGRQAGVVFQHILSAVQSGRVAVDDAANCRHILRLP